MTTIAGNDGDITWISTHGGSGQGDLLYTWTLDFAKTFTEVTGFGSAVLHRHRGGLLLITGSCAGSMDDTSTSAPAPDDAVAAGSAATFYVKANESYLFTALIERVSITVNKRTNQSEATYTLRNGDSDS